MNTPAPQHRLKWSFVLPFFIGGCLLMAGSVYRFVWPDVKQYYSAVHVASRKAEKEWRQTQERQESQIRSIIELAAQHIRSLDGRCFTVPKKDVSLLDGIDLSGWRGDDQDLPLLRVFVLLEDDNRINGHSNSFTLTLGPAATDSSLAYLEGLANLFKLDLSQTQITDAGLAHLKVLSNLERLTLSRTDVTGAGLEHLIGMEHLRELRVDQTRVSDAEAKEWQRRMPYTTIYGTGEPLPGKQEE